ncbi:hypothetical protein HY628_02755 [Candidatus Uhrbacteria bacterium]|nr:hypothetical protein [Candidatus Uhrbacteria bacterium]
MSAKISLIILSLALIAGGSLIFAFSRKDKPKAEAFQLAANQSLPPATPQDTPPSNPSLKIVSPEPVYTNSVYQFSLPYPLGWTYRERQEKDETLVTFLPPAPAPQEAELNPHILVRLSRATNFSAPHSTLEAWFEKEVLANPERYDARRTTRDALITYSFSEGVGEYPHQNAVISQNDRAAWFTIEASDPAMHAAFERMVEAVRLETRS